MKQKNGDWTKDTFKEEVENIVEEKLRTVKPYWVDRMMELLDKSAGNYKKVDETQELLSGRQSEHSDTLEEHETRLQKLEKTVFKN